MWFTIKIPTRKHELYKKNLKENFLEVKDVKYEFDHNKKNCDTILLQWVLDVETSGSQSRIPETMALLKEMKRNFWAKIVFDARKWS